MSYVPSLAPLQLLQRARNKLRLPIPVSRLLYAKKPRFVCPVCGYNGPFLDIWSFAGKRLHAECPNCRALERHRLQYLTVQEVFSTMDTSKAKLLHFAPEAFLKRIFQRYFAVYETADLVADGVDHRVDMQCLPFADASYDAVFASHVLEHIKDDVLALSELRRILRPNGIAILPVPIVGEKTIEYAEPNPHEAGHVRAPGPDYFDRYRQFFRSVEVKTSASFPEQHQLYIYEDRSRWPTPACPLRQPMTGTRHLDFVPVCRV